jgi:hypothetical protein
MARVSFSALIEEIVGKLAGSVFQDSYQGFQIRTRVTPRNPQTNYQQVRRGEFGFITQTWRTMSQAERDTFISAAPYPSAGFNLFVASNVNLSLIGLPMITTYTPSSVPADMPLQLDLYDGVNFNVSASGAVTTVPAGYSLILFATAEKSPTKIFTNPSQFSPISTFAAGVDLSSPVNQAAEWIARYGQFTNDKRICIKSALIDNSNGNRTDAAVSCANQTDMLPYDLYLANISQSGGGDPTVVEASVNTIGPITWTRTGTGFMTGTLAGAFPAGKTFCCSVPGGASYIGFYEFRRVDDDHVLLSCYDTATNPADNILDDFGLQIIVTP